MKRFTPIRMTLLATAAVAASITAAVVQAQMKMEDCPGMADKGSRDMKSMDMKDMPKHCQEMMQKGGMAMSSKADKAAPSATHEGKGKVVKVDAAAGKITLAHEPIKTIGWPKMTMEFGVKDKKALDHVKPGQAVTFTLAQKGSDYVIESIK